MPSRLTSATAGRRQSEGDIFRNCRILYFEILDNSLMQISVRFQDCDKLQFLCLVDSSKFQDHATNFPSEALQQLHQCYPQIFAKLQRLKNELCLLYADENYRDFTPEEILHSLQENQDVFEESYKLFSLGVTIPSTSTSVEMSFCCLQRIKNSSKKHDITESTFVFVEHCNPKGTFSSTY
ncbi:hypothetical protein ANN_03244 [Periplaneta americana]|uniref:Uncharacterized protein n=1 Tax=Periplaneta americana TaxID=6978 RepID=A0ABQ8U1W7_PERAM|nr:hypothetical protein ANN_03244 [Periplaneta americana]